MRREAGIAKGADLTRIMPKIQFGLKSINNARMRIEEIMRQAPEAAQSAVMMNLVSSVQKNIIDINTALDQVESQQGATTHTAIIRKLRNDVNKEEVCPCSVCLWFFFVCSSFSVRLICNFHFSQQAIERALYSGNNGESSTRASMSGGGNGTNGGPGLKRFGSNNSMIPSADDQQLNNNVNNGVNGSKQNKVSVLNNGNTNTNTTNNNNNSSNSNSAASSSKQVVKGGSAGAFSPSVMKSNNSKKTNNATMSFDDDWAAEDGVFLDRTDHERMIEQVSVFCFVFFVLFLIIFSITTVLSEIEAC